MFTFKDQTPLSLYGIIENLLAAQPELNAERIRKAVTIANHNYTLQTYWTSESLLEHTAQVLQLLLKFEPDEDAIIACLLQHILKSKDWTLLHLETEFGPKVRRLMSDINILSYVTLQGKRMTLHDLRLMMVTVSEDVRTILITLVHLTCIVRHLEKIDAERKSHFCRDVLQLFAPVAARLGIYSLKQELESGAFPVLYPHDSERISEQYEQLHAEYGIFLPVVTEKLAAFLQAKLPECRIISREKLPYSVFMKMREKSLTHIEDVPDLFAIRIIVPRETDCYQILGLLHQYATAVPNRFKDYISFPKPNGYQSLHTTLVSIPAAPDTMKFEIQIRTETMHREAELGIAAHWSYKEVGSMKGAMRSVQLHHILAAQETLDDGVHEQLVNHIFVLTPKGDIIELPEGATPLDFAFLIHTDLGLSFKGARVNGAIVPLTYTLENGDIIEIQKNSTPKPTAQWLQVLKTSSARAKLKKYLYGIERPALLVQGKKLLNEQFRKRNLPVLDAELTVLSKIDGLELTLHEREDALVKVGQSAEGSGSLFHRLDAYKHIERQQESVVTFAKTQVNRLQLEGNMQMPYRFAKCCKAEDALQNIVGLINRQGEVMIHRQTCKMIANANSSRMLQAEIG